jgi:hypothetical protein
MELYPALLSRRNLLKLVTGAATYNVVNRVGAAYASTTLQTNERPESSPNPNANKFADDGSARSFAGNTIICPLPKDSLIFRELVRVHGEFVRHEFAKRLALLPPSSYHSTIFSGADDHDRQPNLWPADISLDTPITECNRILAERVSKSKFPVSLPLRYRIDTASKSQSKDISTIRLLPFDETENQKLRNLRDRLSDVMKIHGPDHERYRFHITLGYFVQPRTPEELDDYRRTLFATLDRLTSKIQSIELQAPVFCTFESMLAFAPKVQLNIASSNQST